MPFDWSPQQARALDSVAEWHRACMAEIEAGKRLSKPVFRVFGFAGTGKTTLVKHFAESIEGKTVYGAFTGKAAMVMRQNGCAGATTLHSMIYSCVEDDQTGQITYVWNEDADCGNAALIAVDECSMVDEPMARDILRHDRPVLVLGDPAQLPPVSGAGYFTEAEPDVMLTEIHRQARDNPIIALATTVREGGSLAFGTWGGSSVISTRDLNPQMVLAADQVLVGLNKTREGWNGRMRELLGRKSYLPAPEDRLVCLKNDKAKGLFNGGLFRVLEVKPPKTGRAANGEIAMEILDLNTEGANRPVKVWSRLECFRGGLDKLPREARRGLQEFAFGYALTVHKSQGSQWPNVLVRDESGSFGTERRRHLYTAITRAAERVTIVM